ncbi:MAG TPA: hypothetical protein PLV45_06835, partial [bacterium]|nr:hypothetical protein [bacterium]
MKRINVSEIITVLFVTALTVVSGITPAAVSAAESLDSLSRRHPFDCSWEPLIPEGYSHHEFRLNSSAPVSVTAAPGSGIRIDISAGDPGNLEIYRVFTPDVPGNAVVRIPLPINPDPDGCLVVPGNIADPQTLDLQSRTGSLDIAVFSYRSVHRPVYW